MTIHRSIARTALAWLVAASATLAGTAQATPALMDYSINVAGINSNDELGSPINELRFLNIGYGGRVIGLAWGVDLYADVPSWLSEIAVDISNDINQGLSLQPGFGTDSSGSGSFASMGFIDLVALGADFGIGADGMLRFQFFETFSDFPGTWDGIWERGSLTVRVVPEPSSLALIMLALVGTGALARRRRIR